MLTECCKDSSGWEKYGYRDNEAMDKDSFIRHLDHVYGLVEEEYQKCQVGNGKYEKKHLEFILKELKIMRSGCGSQQFHPYYPRGIADTWDYADKLGNELMELAGEYQRICNS